MSLLDFNRNSKALVVPASRRLLVLVVLGAGLIGGVWLDQLAHGAAAKTGEPDFNLLATAWHTIDRVYVDRSALNSQALTYGALSGLVDALGDTGHSRFLTPAMRKTLSLLERNHFDGIGAELQMKDGRATILAPLDDSPAQRAGIQPGNVILKVNNQSVIGLPLDEIVQHILGPAGTKVTLTLLDPRTDHTRDLTLVRATITVHTVFWAPVPGTSVAHLRIADFNRGLTRELRRALAQIAHAKLRGAILDLRNDPGGLLDEAVAATSQFLSGGNVVLVRDANGQTEPLAVHRGGLAPTLPLVVLVNNGTASAAEIMAGALQDAQRGEIVGDTTVGTGTVLREFGLPDGSAMLLAVQEWLTPAGHGIWHKGITPELAVQLPPGRSPVFPEVEHTMTPAEFQACGDTQLLRALALLVPATAESTVRSSTIERSQK